MKAVGLVVEYNPFHNGHLYHLEASKTASEADAVIAVMSGNFLQRGEPALVSKWARTKMALKQGADLVIELPYAYATQKAETFADGAISILEALGCSSVCFGSENGEISPFLETAELLNSHHAEYQQLVKQFMKEGMSYPSAQTSAFLAIETDSRPLDLSLPNNILGFQYVRAILKQKASIRPLTIKRTAAGYHDEDFNSSPIASATSIRKALFSDEQKDISRFVPSSTDELLRQYDSEHGVLHQWENYFDLLKYTVCTMSTEEMRQIYEVEEGLENRVKSVMMQAESFKEFMEQLKTKRYTWTRLQRMCLHVLTRTTKDQMLQAGGRAPYLRLLGMSGAGRSYLNMVKKNLETPLVSVLSSFSHPLLELDIKASGVHAMILPEPLRSQCIKREYSTRPIQYDREKDCFL
ncbi:nucleotidyltransferase [Metabacillus indicus]|uniref:nucleotidyltransferase n=1 Tax=Metabacillus TaxID=2675233 RepID=UPI00193A03B0|nr:nucleotidyltransferase [Metabacillus sp. cB07]